MSDLNSLTNDLLNLIMQHVPMRDRLTSCCLVNSRLHAAAVAATDALTLGQERPWSTPDIPISSLEHAQAALEWLGPCGQHVTKLVFNSFPGTVEQLPCPKLLESTVEYGCSVQLGPTAAPPPGVISGCTNLTKLDLSCSILDASGGAELSGSLSSLGHLQHLKVQQLEVQHLEVQQVQVIDLQSQPQPIMGLSSGTLPCLTHLTFLSVDSLSVENIHELGALTNLQQLCLIADSSVVMGPSSVPDLVLPASLTQLQVLSPVEAAMLSTVPAGLRELVLLCVVGGPAEGPDSLLSCIAQLSSLTALHIFAAVSLEWPLPGPAYSALTASSDLVKLNLQGGALPVGIWPFVFPASRTLLHLTNIDIGYEGVYGDPALPGAWGAADIACLVSCCPNLCQLDVAVQHGPHVSELHKLKDLTEMHLHYGLSEGSALQATMQGLAAVTQLQILHIDLHRCVVSVAALLPLTSLTALSSFGFICNDYTDVGDFNGAHVGLEVHLLQRACRPAVWLQLLERCAAEPNCQPAALRSLAQHLAEQRALSTRQQDQLAAQQQLNSDQQDQLAAQQREIADLREQLAAQQQDVAAQQQRLVAQEQQLSAQQQVAAEQGAQVAGLQGQLQALQSQLQQLLQQQ